MTYEDMTNDERALAIAQESKSIPARLGNTPIRDTALAVLKVLGAIDPMLRMAVARQCLSSHFNETDGWSIPMHDIPILNEDGRVASLHELDIEQQWAIVSNHSSMAKIIDSRQEEGLRLLVAKEWEAVPESMRERLLASGDGKGSA